MNQLENALNLILKIIMIGEVRLSEQFWEQISSEQGYCLQHDMVLIVYRNDADSAQPLTF